MRISKISPPTIAVSIGLAFHVAVHAAQNNGSWSQLNITNTASGAGYFTIDNTKFTFNSLSNSSSTVVLGAYYNANYNPNNDAHLIQGFYESGLVTQTVVASMTPYKAATTNIINVSGSSTASITAATGGSFNYVAAKPGQGQLLFTLNPAVTSFTITNPTDTHNFSNINGYVSAVPEPETYAMLLAGLGVVALIAHRRNPNSMSSKSFNSNKLA